MAVTLTIGEVAVAIRAATATDSVPGPIQTVLGFIVPAATAVVLRHAPQAPDAVHNAALVRLAGWLFDADPTDSRIADAITVSGAANLLAQWRVHRAAVVEGPGSAPPAPTPGGLPSPPSEGTFILAVKDGVLTWRAFPLP